MRTNTHPPSLNILESEFNIYRDGFVEASAGTGKTFSIENLFVRFLIEKPSVPFEKILIVTFTNAATLEIKTRIRQAISRTLEALQQSAENIPNYLHKILNEDEAEKKWLKLKLEQALLLFDQVHIYTIHSFCHHLLKEISDEVFFLKDGEQSDISDKYFENIVEDYFREGFDQNVFLPTQIAICFAKHRKNFFSFKKSLIELLKKDANFPVPKLIKESLSEFTDYMCGLRIKYSFEYISGSILSYANYFKNCCQRSGQLKKDVEGTIENFAELFDEQKNYTLADLDQCLKFGVPFFKLFHKDNLKERVPPKVLGDTFFWNMVTEIKQVLFPFIQPLSSYAHILYAMGYACRERLYERLKAEQKFRFDDLIHSVHSSLENPQFISRAREKYQVVIIDEFQDTDLLQWEIFYTLYHRHAHMYVVGDPKQAIYAFRQADIYTYLNALDLIGSHNALSLDTNYRSSEGFVRGINQLFSSEVVPELMSLPRTGSFLTYYPVKSSSKTHSKPFNDVKKDIHLVWTEHENHEELIFSYFIQEIKTLRKKAHIDYREWAFLVKDRFQAYAFAKACREAHIPFLLQRVNTIYESPFFPAFLDVLRAVIDPSDLNRVAIAVLSPLVGMTSSELTQDRLNALCMQFFSLKQSYEKKGVALLCHELLRTAFYDDGINLSQKLVSRVDGDENFQILLQLIEALTKLENQTHQKLEKLVDLFEKQAELKENAENAALRQDQGADSVQILTIHFSKGLEFPIVVPLGLYKRNQLSEKDQIVFDPQTRNMIPISDESDPLYLKFCEELDAEKMRQFYVALTRAKYRTYLPFIYDPKQVKPGEGSPNELYLAHIEKGGKKLYDRVGRVHPKQLIDVLNTCDDSAISIEEIQQPFTDSVDENSIEGEDVKLIPPKSTKVEVKKTVVSSFSALTKNHFLKEGSFQQEQYPLDLLSQSKTVHTLPSGTDTGILLHELLQKIHFSSIKENVRYLYETVTSELHHSPYNGWEDIISLLLENTLKVSLKGPHEEFQLCELEDSKILKEVEFLLQVTDEKFLDEKEISLIYNQKSFFLKGVIDCVFEHQGKFFIIDWKSNWLGPSVEYYNQESLERAMRQHHYPLQAKIYVYALQKYLNKTVSEDFEEVFGGVFYLFLRGIDTESPSHGVYYFPGSHFIQNFSKESARMGLYQST
ncbi:MAG: exodeoxyribonuclease V subunit beta [Chlamydiales bacterium]